MEGVALYGERDQLADVHTAIAVSAYHDVVATFERYVEEVGFAQVFHQVDHPAQRLAVAQSFADLFGAQAQRDGGTRCHTLRIDIGQQVIGSRDQLTTLPFPSDRFTGKTYSQDLANGVSGTYKGMTFTYTGDGDRFPSDVVSATADRDG